MAAEPGPVFDSNNPCSPTSIPPTKTALLLMDFHNFLVPTMPPEGIAATRTANSLREWARSQNMFIVHCLIDVRAKTPSQMKMSSMAFQRQAQILGAGDPSLLGEFPEVAARADEYVFWRALGQISCMNSYGIKDFLKEHDIQSLVLTGVATSGCVIDTAKAAADAGLVVTLIRDACADRSVETHEFIVQKILGRQCHVATKDEFVAAWK